MLKGKLSGFGKGHRRMQKDPTFISWTCMMRRCYDPNVNDYQHYGGKGIVVCDRWNEFLNFLEDMGTRPDGKILDRIDNGKNYSRENCRWVTPKDSARNRTNNVMVQFGNATITMTEAAGRLGFDYYRLRSWANWKGFNGDFSGVCETNWGKRKVLDHRDTMVGVR